MVIERRWLRIQVRSTSQEEDVTRMERVKDPKHVGERSGRLIKIARGESGRLGAEAGRYVRSTRLVS